VKDASCETDASDNTGHNISLHNCSSKSMCELYLIEFKVRLTFRRGCTDHTDRTTRVKNVVIFGSRWTWNPPPQGTSFLIIPLLQLMVIIWGHVASVVCSLSQSKL